MAAVRGGVLVFEASDDEAVLRAYEAWRASAGGKPGDGTPARDGESGADAPERSRREVRTRDVRQAHIT